MDYSERVNKVRQGLAERHLAGVIVSNSHNIRHLCGFSAGEDGWLFISADKYAVLTDGRYWAQVARECPSAELIEYRSHEDQSWSVCLARWLQKQGWQGRLGFEGLVSFSLYASMEEGLVKQGPATELVCLGGDLDGLRLLKGAEEVELIRQAATIADRAWAEAIKEVRVGMTEMEFCAALEYHMKRVGSTRPSFDTIVASGPNGAYPHAGVTERAFQEGELITVDFGATYQGFCSDITRTMWLGQLDEKSQRIFSVVKEAHDRALAAVRPGLLGCEADKVARDYIEEQGYGEYFNHSLGHGVGLEVHESPGLRRESQTKLLAGMTATIEPGIYIPGQGGCRVEDLVFLTPEGREVLSQAPYQVLGQSHPLESYKR